MINDVKKRNQVFLAFAQLWRAGEEIEISKYIVVKYSRG
jgi:hypothetical protein